MVSRVKRLENLFITSSRAATIAAVRILLSKRDERAVYVNETINRLNVLNNQAEIIEPPPLNIIGVESTLPAIDCGFFYIIVSTKRTHAYDWGECLNLNRMINSINFSLTVSEYHAARRPYLLAAYVVGFPQEKHANAEVRRDFDDVFSYNHERLDKRCRYSEKIVCNLLPLVVTRFNNRRERNLRIVRTIRFRGENVQDPANH